MNYEKLYILAALILALLCIATSYLFKIRVGHTDALIVLSTVFILHAIKKDGK